MKLKLSPDLRQALRDTPNRPIAIEDDETQRVYVIVEQDWHERAREALERQNDIDAIREGIADMEAGRYLPLEQADAELRRRLGFAPRKS